jgi:hypothetical protein
MDLKPSDKINLVTIAMFALPGVLLMMFGLPWWLAFFIAAVPAALLKSSMLEEAAGKKIIDG